MKLTLLHFIYYYFLVVKIRDNCAGLSILFCWPRMPVMDWTILTQRSTRMIKILMSSRSTQQHSMIWGVDLWVIGFLTMTGECAAACSVVWRHQQRCWWRSGWDRRGWSWKIERTALIYFLEFWIQEGDSPSQTREFTITISRVFAYWMDIAATVVSNRCPSKKMFTNLFLHLAILFLHGFMYFPSQS